MDVNRVANRSEANAASFRFLRQAGPLLSDFRSAFTAALATQQAAHQVVSGENLTVIVRNQLSQPGRTPSNAEVCAGVDRVAKANGLKNPDVIQTGQKIDLSVLQQPLAQPLPQRQGGPVLNDRPLSDFIIHSPVRTQSGLARKILNALQKETPAAAKKSEVWANPLHASAEISSGYGLRKDPFTGRLDFHDGMDFAAPSGTPIYAIKPGTVTFSGWKAGYGRMITVQHEDGLESLYAHTSKNLVSVGQQVNENTVLGNVGSTGRSTGPHLHFETHLRGCTVNPAPQLVAAQTQLARNNTAY